MRRMLRECRHVVAHGTARLLGSLLTRRQCDDRRSPGTFNKMSDFQPSCRGLQRSRCSLILAFVVATAASPSCSDGNETSTRAETNPLDADEDRTAGACLWETAELLSRVNVESPDLIDCGLFLGQQPLDNECFASALDARDAVQITINNCIDCMIHSTYVSVPGIGKLHLYREADYYGDDTRVVRVDSCTDFVAGEGSGANCAQPAILYACSDPLPSQSDL
jgi:hypothetical protein